MSYRNDHDAAIARVDALTHELDRAEAERDHLKAEHERLQTEVDRLCIAPPRGRLRNSRFAFTLLAILAGVALEEFGHDHHGHHRAPPPPPPAPLVAPRVPNLTPPPLPSSPTPRPASTTSTPAKPASAKPLISTPRPAADAYDVDTILACAASTKRAADTIATLTDLRPLRASCRKALESSVRYAAISADARKLLTRWLELEDRLAPSLAAYNTYVLRDPTGTRYRAPAALRDEFHAALSARSALLVTLPDRLPSY